MRKTQQKWHIPVGEAERDPDAGLRLCDHPECLAAGDFRAPRTREPRDGSSWFCRNHVREYNAHWDFFSGMSQADIEAYRNGDSTWHRPTWRLGTRPDGTPLGAWVQDDLGLLSELGLEHIFGRPSPAWEPIDPREKAALDVLDMDLKGQTGPLSLQQLKTRYKELVKRYHPDANGGDKVAEERLKQINQAYSFLLSCGYS